ncbi:MAG: hypothetical protein K2O64_00225 [Lactobacillus sp.]|nr:hypothetical protein [Lactobacillus sp.]
MNIKEIKKFFKHDYPRLSLLATGRYLSMSAIKAGAVNILKKGRHGYYQNVFNLISTTIAKLENTAVHPYKTLIIEYYINNKRLKDIGSLIGYKHTAVCKKLNEALRWLATEYNKQAAELNFEFKFQ